MLSIGFFILFPKAILLINQMEVIMKKVILIGLAVLSILIISVIVMIVISGPKPKDYSHLIEPRITEMSDRHALMVNFEGNPDVVIKAAFGKLFKTYYGLKGVPKLKGQPTPIARYEGFDDLVDNLTSAELKKRPWKGFVSIAVPQSITSLSSDAMASPYPVRIETLDYGKVAEIVHFGTYESETPTIKKLKSFISDQGYEIVGLHEEDYIKGPGFLFTNPKNYITIIRYQVRKK